MGFVRHISDHPKYSWLNDAVCAIAGEVRSPAGASGAPVKQAEMKLGFSVAQVTWESPPE
jgi:hypothetical protein